MSRTEILNTFPNLAGAPRTEPLIAQLPRAYLPPNVNPTKNYYHFDRYRLLNLSQTDSDLRHNNFQEITPAHNGQASSSHFYSTSGTFSNGYGARSCRGYIQQNISHHQNAIQHPGGYFQSNFVTNFVMEVMGNMVRSFRQQHIQHFAYQQHHHRFQHHNFNPVFETQPSSVRDYGMGYRRGYSRGSSLMPKGKHTFKGTQ